MASPAVISSSRQLDSIASSSTYVFLDFHATWCGPCKQIAPVFEALAKEHTRIGRLAFAKVDVDAQPDIAQKYGVRAMPTFVILKSAQVADTVRGANPAALRAAVLKAANDACKSGPASSANFQTKGQTLGSSEAPTTSGGGPTLRSWIGGGGGSWADALLRMSGLYIETLFSTDPRAAAETSQWRVQGSARFDR